MRWEQIGRYDKSIEKRRASQSFSISADYLVPNELLGKH